MSVFLNNRPDIHISDTRRPAHGKKTRLYTIESVGGGADGGAQKCALKIKPSETTVSRGTAALTDTLP